MPQARHSVDVARGRWVGLLRRAEDKRQAVHQKLSQCQLGRDSECVRKDASRGGNKVTLPGDVLEPLPLAGVSFCLALSTDQVALPTNSFKLQNASKALLLVLQGIKKPAVTRTSGRVMGELTIWPSF